MRRFILVFAVLFSAAPACRRDGITHFRVRKTAEPAFARTAAPGRAEVAPPPAPDGVLEWTLPPGWTESATGGMRYATLKPSVEGRVDVSVVVLPGPAGGELANVNRWRGQLGLGPMDGAALTAARNTIHTKAGAVSLYDFTSEGDKKSRLIAGLAVVGDSTWFVKMLGDAGPVAAARPDFIHLLQSLRNDQSN